MGRAIRNDRRILKHGACCNPEIAVLTSIADMGDNLKADQNLTEDSIARVLETMESSIDLFPSEEVLSELRALLVKRLGSYAEAEERSACTEAIAQCRCGSRHFKTDALLGLARTSDCSKVRLGEDWESIIVEMFEHLEAEIAGSSLTKLGVLAAAMEKSGSCRISPSRKGVNQFRKHCRHLQNVWRFASCGKASMRSVPCSRQTNKYVKRKLSVEIKQSL